MLVPRRTTASGERLGWGLGLRLRSVRERVLEPGCVLFLAAVSVRPGPVRERLTAFDLLPTSCPPAYAWLSWPPLSLLQESN